eukprot:2125356-Pleurochrysis_carterae.AAC.1
MGVACMPRRRRACCVESSAEAYSARRTAATVTRWRRRPRPCGRPYRERVGASEDQRNGMK